MAAVAAVLSFGATMTVEVTSTKSACSRYRRAEVDILMLSPTTLRKCFPDRESFSLNNQIQMNQMKSQFEEKSCK